MGTPLRVLIIEDSEDDTLLIIHELKRGGYDPKYERVDTAGAMIASLDKQEWDIVISDHSMPHFNSFNALDVLKKRGLDLPFFLVSGTIDEEMAVLAMKAGVHDYIMKGNLKRLIPAIARELRDAEVRQDRKRKEEALRESEKRYRQVIENATEIIYVIDDKGNFTYGNPAGLKVTGYSLAELRGFNYADLVLPEHRERVMEIYINQFRQRIPTTHVEFPFFNKAGKIVWFSQNSSLVIEDEKVTGFHIIARDITERKKMEEKLRKSEASFQELFDEAPVGYHEYDVQGRITSVNRTELEMLGYTPEEMTGQPVWKFIIEEEEARQRILAKLAGTMPPGRAIERTYRRKDGTTFPVLIEDRIVRNLEGAIIGIRSTIQDITERKRAEEALHNEEKRFQTLSDQAPFGMVMIGQDGTFKYMNTKFRELFGYDLTDIPDGKAWFRKAYPNPTYRHDVIEAWINDLKSSKPGEKRSQIFTVTCKDGTEKTINFIPVQLETGENLMACEDITERKRAEEALRESEKKYRTLITQSPDGIFIVDLQGTFLAVNKAMCERLKYSEEEFLSMKIWDIVPEKYVELHKKRLSDILRGEAPNEAAEYMVRGKDEKMHYIEILSTPYFRENEVIGLQGIARDITERKRAEEEREKMLAQLIQAQKMESIGTLAGGVAHDFNNLLTTIQGYAQLAMMSLKESDPFYEDFKEIQQASMRAAKLTRQLLLFSRQQAMDLHSITLNETVDNLMKMLKRLIGEDITVQTDLDPNLWTNMADPGNMEQVIMNLVVNARDAMPEEKKITIKTENVDIDEGYCEIYKYAHPGKFVCLSVEDIGIGMDKEVIQHIFEPFFTTKGPGKGTGLGLSVVYGIVKQHEGWINVYSEPGRGSVFKVYLPASSVESKGEAKEEVISIQDCHGKGERILLVEDDDGIREFAKRVLVESGYVGFEAANAEEALNIFGKEKGDFHLVFSDVVLPEKSGLQLVEQLLCRKPELKVLLTSGYTDQKSQWPIIREKGYRFIQKPYALTDLLRVVREVIEQGK